EPKPAQRSEALPHGRTPRDAERDHVVTGHEWSHVPAFPEEPLHAPTGARAAVKPYAREHLSRVRVEHGGDVARAARSGPAEPPPQWALGRSRLNAACWLALKREARETSGDDRGPLITEQCDQPHLARVECDPLALRPTAKPGAGPDEV